MNYNVYFDVLRDGYQGLSTASGSYLALVMLAVIVIIFIKCNKEKTFGSIALFILLTVLSVSFLIWNWRYDSGKNKEYSSILQRGAYKTVEGQVRNVRISYGKHDMQYFSVNGINFKITENTVSGGFNRTILNGGPLRENVYVRLSYIESYGDKIILRVEIAQQK